MVRLRCQAQLPSRRQLSRDRRDPSRGCGGRDHRPDRRVHLRQGRRAQEGDTARARAAGTAHVGLARARRGRRRADRARSRSSSSDGGPLSGSLDGTDAPRRRHPGRTNGRGPPAPAAEASAASSVPLGAAGSSGVLTGASVPNTGLTVIDGDLGVSPWVLSVIGFPPGTLSGRRNPHINDALAVQSPC